MEFRAFDELTKPDERTLVFGPFGSSPSPDRAAAALKHRQRAISSTDLVADVPESVRQNFERLRIAYVYGLLCYELFTIVEQTAFFLLEHALGERLLEHYDRCLPLVNGKGEEKSLAAANFYDVHEALRRKGSHAKGRWYLPVSGGGQHELTGSLNNLFGWARAEGFLHGQRSRWSERFLVERRNYAAHPAWHEKHSPGDAAEAIRDVSEIINRLWGSSTPGGRLFPAPIERHPIAIGWGPAGAGWDVTLAHNLSVYGKEGWLYVIVRGLFHDDDLTSYATDFELTTFPTEWLWGPGSFAQAIEWLEREQPGQDCIDYLDRRLFVRVRGKEVELPRRPEVAAAITDDVEGDVWHLVLADFPLVAYSHVRAATLGSEDCAQRGPCSRCQAHTLAAGARREVLEQFEERYGKAETDALHGVAVPGFRSPLAGR